ncbi:MAG: diacylglycerol kinase family lipid kinase [Anaerolineales bacterium]|jgi:YegS/Rv2252/BmrU family lipid kinase
MTRYNVIVNPTSGRGRGEEAYPLIESALNKLRLDFEMCRTEAPGHAIELAEAASKAGCDVVVSAGGDGTANEVVNGLTRARLQGRGTAALGLISVGRGNDFAYGVDTPPDLSEACLALAEGKRKTIDMGLSAGGDYPKGRFFGNGVGIGFDAVVGFEALKLKRLHGFPSYIVAALKTIFLYYQAPTVRIEYDGEVLTQPALMVSVMNGRRLGGGFMMAPEGQIDDGLFDLTIADQVDRASIFGLILRFMQGSQVGHPAIKTARAAKVTITAEQGSLPAHADGETICEAGDKLELEIVPQALEVIIPERHVIEATPS